jgi:hypothetical protein
MMTWNGLCSGTTRSQEVICTGECMKEESHRKDHVFETYLYNELGSDGAIAPKRKSKPNSTKSLEECDTQRVVKREPSKGVKK